MSDAKDEVDASADSPTEAREEEDYFHGFEDDEIAAFKATAEHFATEMEVIRSAIAATYSGESGEIALFFMANYCHGAKATYTLNDPVHSAYLEGRRSWYLKVMEYLHLDDRQLIERATNRALGTR